MFNFDVAGYSNFKYSGTIKVSVSDGFSYWDWYYGLVNDVGRTLSPLSSAEVPWSSSDITNIQGALSILSSFANFSFSSVTDYDTAGTYSICSPYDVGVAGVSDINITYSYNLATYSGQLLGISGGSLNSFGYVGSKGDIFINYIGSVFTDGLNFSDYTKSRQVLLHELCHSLGLSHPFYNGYLTSDYGALTAAGFQSLGFKINSASDLNKEYF
jgi:hypothetical protein